MNKTEAREAWSAAVNAYTKDPEYLAAKVKFEAEATRIREKYKPAALEAQAVYERIEAAEEAKKLKSKARWPENTPAAVLETCNKFWSGSEEFTRFRIH